MIVMPVNTVPKIDLIHQKNIVDSQGSHACQTKECAICEFADVVPLELQHL